MLADSCAAVIAAIAAVAVRFGTHADARYPALSLLPPLLWTTAVRLFGGYERLRTLAWNLEKTGADRCVAPALLAQGSGAHWTDEPSRLSRARGRPHGTITPRLSPP